MPFTRRITRSARSALCALAVVALAPSPPAGSQACAAAIDEGFEGPAVAWRVAESDCNHRLVDHGRSTEAPHRGEGCERLVIEASGGTTLRLAMPLGPVPLIDEFTASLWVRANRPDIRLSLRVSLPNSIDAKTGRPITVLVPGNRSIGTDRWERLEITAPASRLAGRIAALRAEHGSGIDLAGATVTELVLDLYSAPGRYELAIDDLSADGIVSAATVADEAGAARAGGPAASAQPPVAAPVAASPDVSAGLARGVIEVAGLPFFPRAVDHNGEPLEAIAALGFNCVRLREPASAELLASARRCGLWVVCPPPDLPDVDVEDPESLPVFSTTWDRVLAWDLGEGLTDRDLDALAERARRVRACDFRPNRPLFAAADSGLRSLSRHVDLLVARRTVLGTSLELTNYLAWLRERPRLARPGTPLFATLSTQIDPSVARQASLLSGAGGRGLSVDPESMAIASFAAVSAGVRGILFSSASRIDANDDQTVLRALAARETNLRLAMIEPWAASGRFASVAQTSDPEVQAVVIEAARTRLVLLFRVVQGTQTVARRYHGDLPDTATGLSVLVPGVPEPHQAWLSTATGLRPLKQKRVTGGMSLTIDSFHSSAVILLSGDAAITGDVQRRVRENVPRAIESLRALASRSVADASAIVARMSPQAFGTLPVSKMIAEAEAARVAGEGLLASDTVAAADRFAHAYAVAGQVERLAWERGVMATGSMVADALSASDATLAEHWNFVEAIARAGGGPEQLAGGSMDRLEDLAQTGWRHFVLEHDQIRSGVEISRITPAGGTGCLRLVTAAVSKEQPPVVVETPPLWITTPEIEVPAGKLVRIEADVQVPRPVTGSVDGLLVFDSIGGPALAERVGPSPGWRKLVLYRIAGSESPATPLVVTFAMTGLGEARIDSVSVKVMERGAAATVPTTPASFSGVTNPAAAPPQPAVPFELPGTRSPGAQPPAFSAPMQPPPVERTPPSEGSNWPGMNLEWPSILPFGGSSNTPPPGPGGGRVDPFKRARAAAE